ncbi:MAG: hypothetical protein AAFQ82_21625, partial [Myxococcota bacterium]
MVWLHAGTSTELHGALIDLGDGSVIRSGLLTTTDANTELGVASDGTNFLVAAKSMRVWRVSGTTGLLDSSPVTIVPSGHSAQSDIQFADGRYYVAATSRLLDGSDDVFLIRIRDDGTGDPVVESETTVFADTVEKAFRPRLAVGESTLLASWMYYVSGQPDRAFVAQRLRFDGTLVGERITLADMTGTGIADTAEAVGVGTDGYLVTWPGAPVPVYPMHRIWMATVDSAGVLSASTDLGVDTNGCVAPSLARIGSEYVSVYKCMSSGNELLLQPVDSAGTELTVDPLFVANTSNSQTQVVADGGVAQNSTSNEVLVAWIDDRSQSNSLYSSRFSIGANGELTPIQQGVFHEDNASTPAVSSFQQTQVLTWADGVDFSSATYDQGVYTGNVDFTPVNWTVPPRGSDSVVAQHQSQGHLVSVVATTGDSGRKLLLYGLGENGQFYTQDADDIETVCQNCLGDP